MKREFAEMKDKFTFVTNETTCLMFACMLIAFLMAIRVSVYRINYQLTSRVEIVLAVGMREKIALKWSKWDWAL